MMKKLFMLFTAVAISVACMTTAEAIDMKLNGVFKTWSIGQNDFRMGKDDINDWYTVSLVRLKPTFSAFDGDVKVHLRMDLAQGWWGVDNQRAGMKNSTGGRRTHAGQNGLFTNKETNYNIHVDEAWIDLKLPFMDGLVPTKMHLGRMYTHLGNKLVFDYEVDGVRFVSKWNDTLTSTIGYTVLNEGYLGLSDNKAAQYTWDSLGQGGPSGGAARMAYIQLKQKLPNKMGALELFFLGYHDSGTDDGTAYIIEDIDYSIAHFKPQIGTLFAVGLAGNLKLDNNMITVKWEVDGLWGKDPVDNVSYNSNGLPGASSAANGVGAAAGGAGANGTLATITNPGYAPPHYWNRLDRNNGDINGWNVYMNTKFHYLAKDYKITPGLIVGAGSGDDDVRSGSGNVNKLQTEGWFYVCEVWEDSIMPDLTGITPQGLGSPWSRGYREFENQVLVQLNNTWKPFPKWSIFLSYSFIQALNEIAAWEDEPTNHNRHAQNPVGPTGLNAGNNYIESTGPGGTYAGGPDYTRTSKDIGHEIDWKVDYKIYPKLTLTTRGGYFFTGEGASLLIAGAKGWDRNVWEVRWDLTFKF